MDTMFEALRKYAQFSGRARRQEYWMFTLLMIVISVVAQVLMGLTGGSPMQPGASPSGLGMAVAGLFGLVFLGLFIPSLAVSFRRLHDTNRSAWWLLIALVPFIGGLVLLVFMVLPGTPGPNRFGEDPLGGAVSTAEPTTFA